jgi:hypothetical protein
MRGLGLDVVDEDQAAVVERDRPSAHRRPLARKIHPGLVGEVLDHRSRRRGPIALPDPDSDTGNDLAAGFCGRARCVGHAQQ